MARRKFPEFIVLWTRHEECYINIFSLALQKLHGKPKISGDEDNLSEILYRLLNKVCFEISKTKKREVICPVAETPIRPVAADESNG